MDKIYNDFTINVATANGTGSQSSNLIILHSMFEMGVPVSGRIYSLVIFLGFPHGSLSEQVTRDIKHPVMRPIFRLS